MAGTPVIETADQAREAKLLIDRGVEALRAVEGERAAKVAPLNTALDEINGEYKAVHNTDKKRPGTFDKVLAELRQRLSSFMLVEEAKRLREAEEARLIAEAKMQAAHAAEQAEREAVEDASGGILDIDIAGKTEEADQAFAEFKRADHQAALAERESTVRIGGGFGKVATLRDYETLVVTDAFKALTAMGVSDKVREAILTAARGFKREYGFLPDGIESRVTRKT